jgi:hypothetical protein
MRMLRAVRPRMRAFTMQLSRALCLAEPTALWEGRHTDRRRPATLPKRLAGFLSASFFSASLACRGLDGGGGWVVRDWIFKVIFHAALTLELGGCTKFEVSLRVYGRWVGHPPWPKRTRRRRSGSPSSSTAAAPSPPRPPRQTTLQAQPTPAPPRPCNLTPLLYRTALLRPKRLCATLVEAGVRSGVVVGCGHSGYFTGIGGSVDWHGGCVDWHQRCQSFRSNCGRPPPPAGTWPAASSPPYATATATSGPAAPPPCSSFPSFPFKSYTLLTVTGRCKTVTA